jgi:putative ABC transport system permease protein
MNKFIVFFFRKIRHNPSYYLIILFGLSIGIVSCLLIGLYVTYNKSFDGFHKNADNIYCLQSVHYNNSRLISKRYRAPSPMGMSLKSEFPEVKEFVKLEPQGGWSLRYNDHNFKVADAWYASSSFFKVFTHEFKYGNPETALNVDNAIVISESLSKKLFGNANPIGETIKDEWANNEVWLTVKGVFKDVPQNSHLKFDLLCKLDEKYLKGNWENFGYRLYLLLDESANVSEFEAKLDDFYKKKQGGSAKKTFSLKQLRDIYLYSDQLLEERTRFGDIRIIRLLSLVMFCVLVIVWINYINLTTIKAFNRGKEVGLKKVFGANRFQIIMQFLVESVFLNIIALVIGIVMFLVFLPFFNDWFGLSLSVSYFNNPVIYFLAVSIFVTGTLLSGCLVAIIMSSFKAITIINKIKKNPGKGVFLRKSLIIFQFVLAIILVTGTIVIYNQISYMRNQPLGFDINNILLISRPDGSDTNSRDKIFLEQITKHSNVKNATLSCYPGQQYYARWSLAREGEEDLQTIRMAFIDENFISTYGIDLISGRNLSKEINSDKNGVIINESAVKMYGFVSPGKAIGETLEGYGDKLQIVGVIKDYNQMYLKEPVSATGFIFANYYPEQYYSLRLGTKDKTATLDFVETTFKQIFPDYNYGFLFLKEHYNNQYKGDWEFGKLFTFFTSLTIFIACLGLWALTLYMLECQTKEIGIRKVNGAKISEVMAMLNKDFVKWIAIAFVIATPIAYFAMHKWLENFAYKTTLCWWIFALAGAFALGIALLTVSWQSWKAAIRNPVEALRYE